MEVVALPGARGPLGELVLDLAGGLARQDPALGRDALVGARALALLKVRFTTDVLAAWADDRSSLLLPLPVAVGRA